MFSQADRNALVGALAGGTKTRVQVLRDVAENGGFLQCAAKTALIMGEMTSIVNLRFTDGTTAHLTETVPFLAYAKDNGTPGGGADFFSLTVDYTDTPGLDQFDLFGSPATFSGIVETGDVTVR